jgi:hypothetical protein
MASFNHGVYAYLVSKLSSSFFIKCIYKEMELEFYLYSYGDATQ